MIVDNIKNAELYENIHPKLKKAFEFLKNTDLGSLVEGKYMIEEPDVFALVQFYTTKEMGTAKLEAHEVYTDLQYVVEGCEKMGYTELSNTNPATEYDADRDIVFLNGEAEFLTTPAGTFVVFAPTDAHMPSMACNGPSPVKKIVIKIKL